MTSTTIHGPFASSWARIGLVALAMAALALLAFSPVAQAHHEGPSPADIAMMQQMQQQQMQMHVQMQMQAQIQQQQMQMRERMLSMQAPQTPFFWSHPQIAPFPPTWGPAWVEQESSSVRVGRAVRFSGHGFAPRERVSVILNGNRVATASANRHGDFSVSTSAVYVPLRPYEYLFIGQESGASARAIVIPRP